MKKLLVVVMAVMALSCLLAVPAFSADKLIVKDNATPTANTVFVVTDGGLVGIGNGTPTEPVDVVGDGISTNFRLTRYGANPGAIFRAAGGTAASPSQVLANGLLGGFVAAGWQSGGAFSGNMVGIYFRAAENFTPTAQGTYLDIETTPIGSTTKTEKMRVTGDGKVGIGTTNPARLLSVGTGGAGSDGTVWYSSSSRALKQNIHPLDTAAAVAAIENMTPVTYQYKAIPDYTHVGFIAEDVPSLVATPDRKTLSTMDIVAVLTKVVQEQQKTIQELNEKLNLLEGKVSKITGKDMVGRLDVQ